MPYIPPEVVEKAREMDLLTYLKSYEPQELVHFGGNTLMWYKKTIPTVPILKDCCVTLKWGKSRRSPATS